MGFHSVLAYFTGYKYEPDPEVSPEQEAGLPLRPDDMTSIVETIIREKADQEPEEQAATAEGDVTFSDLMRKYEESDAAEGPPPLPSVLDAPGSFDTPGSLFDTPQDRLVQDDSGLEDSEAETEADEGAEAEAEADESAAAVESDAWLSDMGLMGQGDMQLDRSLQGQPDDADRLGLDNMFGQGDDATEGDTGTGDTGAGDTGAGDTGMGGMFGGEPGYEDLVGEALSDEGLSGEMGEDLPGEGEPELFEDMEDLLPVDEGDIVPAESGDRGFAKSVLLADERTAALVARRVLASVTININVGEGGEEESGDEEFDLGEGFDLGGEDELGSEEGDEELGGEELDLGGEGEELDLGGEFDLFGEEAESILRRVLANDVTININIGDGEEVDIDAPEDLLAPPEEELPEDLGDDLVDEVGEDLGEEGLGEELGDEGLGEELGAAPKKGDGESFDELNDLEDVFQTGDKNDGINEFGI